MTAIERATQAITPHMDRAQVAHREDYSKWARDALDAACTVAIFVRVQAEHEFRSRGSSSYLCSCRQVIPVAQGDASWTERAAAALHWHRAEELRAELLREN